MAQTHPTKTQLALKKAGMGGALGFEKVTLIKSLFVIAGLACIFGLFVELSNLIMSAAPAGGAEGILVLILAIALPMALLFSQVALAVHLLTLSRPAPGGGTLKVSLMAPSISAGAEIDRLRRPPRF